MVTKAPKVELVKGDGEHDSAQKMHHDRNILPSAMYKMQGVASRPSSNGDKNKTVWTLPFTHLKFLPGHAFPVVLRQGVTVRLIILQTRLRHLV